LGKRNLVFRWNDVIEKFGWETTCYLTGDPINLREPLTYQFDHKIPSSRGGTGDISNLGIALRAANQAKSDMTIEELLSLCSKILQHNGYKVEKL
jgi:5-methylcytosine-specific restriction endonuclease McrA